MPQTVKCTTWWFRAMVLKELPVGIWWDNFSSIHFRAASFTVWLLRLVTYSNISSNITTWTYSNISAFCHTFEWPEWELLGLDLWSTSTFCLGRAFVFWVYFTHFPTPRGKSVRTHTKPKNIYKYFPFIFNNLEQHKQTIKGELKLKLGNHARSEQGTGKKGRGL